MMTATSTTMTAGEFVALPDDGTDRMLIRGRVWERPWRPNDRWHARTNASVSYLLLDHLMKSEVGAELLSSCDCFLLRRSPDTVVGIDVAYLSEATLREVPENDDVVECVPTMAVEILAVDDSFGELVAKIDEFLYAGTQTVWVADPHFRTVVAYRQNARPKMYSGDEVISTGPFLPGFAVPVSKLFQR